MRSMALWMCLLCIVFWTTWTHQTSSSDVSSPHVWEQTRPSAKRNGQVVGGKTPSPNPGRSLAPSPEGEGFIYTRHARERMEQRGANDNEVKQTILTGAEVPARDGKQKFEKTFDTQCIYQGKTYGRKKVEVVTARNEEDWVIITVIADCK